MKKRTLTRVLALALSLVLCFSILAACDSNSNNTTTSTQSSPPAETGSQGGTSTAPADTGSQGEASTSPEGNTTPADPGKTEILLGASRPLSGVYQVFEDSVFGPIYKMWVDEINADGGIYVEEYGKKLPLRVITYDDTSDMGTMVRMTEKLILEDKVDLMLPSCSTAFVFAQAEITNKYGKLLISAEGGSAELSASYEKYPLFFNSANHSVTQVPELVKVLTEMGVTSVYIMYVEDSHGLEYSGTIDPLLKAAGIEIKAMKAVPPDIADLSPVITDAMASEADAFLSFCYPDQNFPAFFTALAIGYNPKAMLFGPGGNMDVFPWAIAGENAEGIMGFGGFNAKSSPGAKEFIDKYNALYAEIGLDWWGHLPYYAALQVLAQAIEGAGTLDNEKIADYIRNNTFGTNMGPVYFHNGQIAAECYLGQVGQWQSGIFEVIDTNERRTADPIYPKPDWK